MSDPVRPRRSDADDTLPVGGDGREPAADAELVLRALLVDMGVDEADVDRAIDEGTIHLLALERLVALEQAEYTLDEVAEMSGLPTEHIRAYWRALGFPEPRPGEKVFSETDLDMLASVLPFAAEGALESGLAVQMARVIGSSLARVATAQIEAIEHQIALRVERGEQAEARQAALDAAATGSPLEGEEGGEPTMTGPAFAVDGLDDLTELDEADLADAARQAAELLPAMPRLMEFVWRRHLGAAARRRIMRASASTPTEQACVGFADLVGFTAQTQQLPDDELAKVVDRFETIAYDTVISHGGRVVKTIGDEVMFLADGVHDGAEIALALAERYSGDESLSDVRVGLASGPVLERDGDVYGTTVNRAHRIVAIAYPGSVVVSDDIADALADDEALSCRSIRSHYLKDIGRVPLFTLRRAGDDTEQPYARARARRAARRDFVLQRRLRRRRQSAETVEEALAELPVDAAAELPMELLDEEELAAAPTGQFEALTDAVLGADLDRDLQVELLADLEAARRLRALEEEAQQKAAEADLEAERKLVEIEDDARRRIEQLEAETRRKVEDTLREAEEKSRKANEEANRKVRRVAEEAERKAERAEKDAKREARRRASRRKPARPRDQPPDGDEGGEPPAGPATGADAGEPG